MTIGRIVAKSLRQHALSTAVTALSTALAAEYRVCTRLYAHGEFLEGIRALLVDKDKSPKWNPPDLAGVTDAMIESFFEPLSADEERFWNGREPGR